MEYEITGEVQLFPGEGGWFYVDIPVWMPEELGHLMDRGLVAVTASVGRSTWDTSLLPKGNGRHFLALKAPVRKANDIELGDEVTVRFTPRAR